jgi:hypothetical protein
MMPDNFVKLLWHSLKEKKNWFLLSMVVLFTTVVVVPLLIGRSLEETNILIGIVEIFIVIFVNCIIDLNYLHDTKKYSYYLSKPFTDRQKINLIILNNLIFALLLIFPLWFISFIQGFDLSSLFIVSFPWLIIGVFVAALSGVLAGNIIISGIATIFNFALPLSILGVIYFALDIVQNSAIGFDVNILMRTFIANFYKIDYLYFIKFIDEPNWPLYVLLLITLCFGIYGLTLKLLKKRKNERIGQLIVFTGYKNFIALLVSTLVPFMFSTLIQNKSYIGLLLSFLILGSITYYVTLAILEKTFKLEKKSFKLLTVFMTIFISFVLISGMITKHYESYIPNLEDIEGVLITNRQYFYNEDSDHHYTLSDIEISMNEYDETTIYASEEAIEAICSIHKTILNDDTYNRYASVNIVYFLNDGNKIRRYYRLDNVYGISDEEIDEEINLDIDEAAHRLELTREYKYEVLKFIYDDDYSKSWQNKEVSFSYKMVQNKKVFLTQNDILDLREALKKDLEEYTNGSHSNLLVVLSQNNNYFHDFDYYLNTPDKETKDYYDDVLYVEFESGSANNESYFIPDNFINTRTILKKYTELE